MENPFWFWFFLGTSYMSIVTFFTLFIKGASWVKQEQIANDHFSTSGKEPVDNTDKRQLTSGQHLINYTMFDPPIMFKDEK